MSRVAVVGAGVAGLVAARELDRAGHEVAVFEAGDHAGGHANTVRVEDDEGSWDVDTGFIVFNDRNYPNFERLLGNLGVATQRAPMELSVADRETGYEWASRPGGLFASPRHLFDPEHHRMHADLVRFFGEARALVGRPVDEGPSLRTFLDDRGYSRRFVERLIVPQASAVWSADPERLWDFPAAFLATFLHNHGALQLRGRPRWRTVTGGSRSYVEALVRPFAERVHLGTPVRRVRRGPAHVELTLDDSVERFDEVVLAVHSDQALRLLADPSALEHEILGAIPYERNEAVLHSDERLLPRRARARASWNFHLTPEPTGKTTVSYWMNRLQGLGSRRQYVVTLNRTEAIDPRTVIRAIDYAHPIYTPESIAAQDRWAEISGHRRTHYCGAYWRWGFHEDGVWSALRACERAGSLPREITPLVAPPPALAA